MKLIIMQFSPRSVFLHFRSKYLPQHSPFSKTLSLCSSPKVRDQVSHPYSTTGKITVLYVLMTSGALIVIPTPLFRLLPTYLPTYVLTPWCRKLFEKLIVTQLVRNVLLSLWNPRVHHRFT
jgi:hypothetical protein